MLSLPASLRVRYLAGCFLALLSVSLVRGVPASPEIHEFTQPNGVTFSARLVGDEGFSYYLTTDGHPIDYDSVTQWWYYNGKADEGTGERTGKRVSLDVPPGPAWRPKMPAEERKRRQFTTYTASIPSVKRLPGRAGAVVPQNAYVAMLLTNFPQSTPGGVPTGSLPVQTTPAEFQAAWFSDSTPGNTVFSAREYYKQASYGKHLISAGPAGIKDWITAPKMREQYGLEPTPAERTMGGPTRELVRWRVAQADAANFDFGPYDTDNDGFVDITCVVFQGTAQSDTGKVQDLWPIRYFLEDSTDPANPRRIYETNDVNALGNPVKVRDYIIVPELTPLPGGASKGFDTCTIGVFCHEYGHGIGWPDLYDYDSEGVGRWCLMSTGCYTGSPGGRSGDRPVWPGAWCRAFSNWVTPVNVTVPLNDYNIPETKSQNTVMRMWRNGAMGPEYFLVENRSNTGWDVSLPGSGLLVWHVDDNKPGNGEQWWRYNSPGGDTGFFSAGHYRVALEQSDGRFDMEQKANAGDAQDSYAPGSEFSNSSVPNSRDYANALTDVTVTDIQPPQANGTIRADLFVSPDHAAPVISAMNPDDGLYYYTIPSLAGAATDDTGVQAVEVSLQRLSPTGEEWYDWVNAQWGPFSLFSTATASLSGPVTNRSFIRGINSSHVTPGSYVFHARAVDTGGFEGEWRRTRFQVIPDPNVPNVTFSEPSPWENYSSGVPDFSGTAVNVTAPFTVQTALKMETGAEAGRFYQWGTNSFSAAGSFTTGNLLNMNASPWTIPMGARPLNEGTYTLYARVDVNGVVSPWRAQAFRVGLPVRVTVTSPAHLSLLRSISSIGGTVADPSGTGIAGGVSFTLRNPAGQYWNGAAWVGSLATLTAPVSGDTWYYAAVPPAEGLLAGTYQISASVSNLAGETSPAVSGGSQTQFAVDTIAPSAAILSPLAGATVTTSPLPAFHGTLSDPGGIGYVNCYIRRNRDSAYWNGTSWTLEPSHAPEDDHGDHAEGAPPVAILRSTFNAASGTWSCTSPLPVPRISMENGSYTFMVIVADRAGNYVQVDASLVLDFHQLFVWTGATLRDGITWNNTNSWDAAANWSPNGIPGADDYVQISNGDTVYNYFERTVRGFRLGSGILASVDGGSLTPTHDSTWTGGRIAGAWIQPAGSTVVVSGDDLKYLNDYAVLDIRGVLEWQGGAPILGQCLTGEPPVINVHPGGVFRIAGDGTLFSKQYGNLTPVFNNLTGGRIEKSAGAGIAYWYYWTLENRSDVFLNSGSLYPYANNVNFRDGSALMGGAKLMLNTNFTLYTNSLFATAAVDFFGGFISCENAAGCTWSGPGVLDWSTGTLWGKLTRPAPTYTLLSGADLKLMADGSEWISEGTVEWSGTGSIRAQCLNAPAPRIRNTGTFRAQGGGDFLKQYGNQVADFYNESGGTFIKSNEQTTHSSWRFHNAGSVQIQQGWLEFHSDGNHTGNFSIAENCALNLLSGTHSLVDGIVFSGAGRVRQVSATVNAAGSIFNNLTAGYELRGGWLSLAPRLRGSGPWKWMTGGMSGSIRLDAGCSLTLYDEPGGTAGIKEFWDDTVFENYGTVEWQGGSSIRSRNLSGAPFTFNNRSVFRCSAAGTPLTRQYGNTTSVFNNLPGAKLEREGTGIAYWYYWTLNNESELAVPSGEIYFNVNASNFKEGAVISGGGTVWLNTEVRLSCNRFYTTARVNWLGGFISSENGVTRTWAGPGQFNWTAGSLWGALKLEAGVDTLLSGADLKILSDGAELINEGTLRWTGDGSIRGVSLTSTGATIRNRSIFIADTPSDLVRQYANVPSNFYNEPGAVFTKTNPATTHCTWQFHNAGTVNIDQGWLEWHSSGNHTGTFNIATGSLLHLLAGTHSLADGIPFSGGGSVLMNGAVVNAAGVINNNLGAGIELRNGWLQQNPQMRGSGVWNWTGGGMAGTLSLAAGCLLNIYDRPGAGAIKEFWDDTVLENMGTIVWQGGSSIRSNNLSGAPFTLNNRGTFRMAADGTPFTVRYGNTTTVFNNLPGAKVEVLGSGYTYWYYWTLNNESEIQVPAGTLYPYVNKNNFRDGSLITGNGAVILNSEVRLYTSRLHSTAALNFTGNYISAEGGVTRTLAGPGRLTWTGGTIWGSLRRDPGTVTVVEGTDVKMFADGSEFINEGDFTYGGTGFIRAVCLNAPAHVFRNLPGGVFRANNTASFTRQYGNAPARFENSGTVEIGGNYWYLNGWNYVQQPSGALYSDITPAGHDQIVVSNAAVTAGGSLHLRRAAGFTPPQGTVYPILTGSSRGGNFSAVTGGFSASYIATAARVTPLPPAETYAEWIAAAGFSGPDAARSADPDQDGLDNFTEFAFKGNPGLAADLSFDRSLLTIDGEQWITLHYRRWQDREQAGVVYEPGASPELSAWGLSGLVDEPDPTAAAVPNSAGWRARIRLGGVPRFLRVGVRDSAP